MKKAILLCALIFLPLLLMAKFKKTTLFDAINNSELSVKAVNIAGHYTGKSTKLTITNNTKSELGIVVNPGIIFKPDDTLNQPMVFAGGEYILVQPNSEKQVDVATYCGNCPKHCPAAGSMYSFSHMGSDALVQVLQFLKTNLITGYAAQSAVWVITNNHDVGGAYYAENEEVAQRLTALLCRLTHQQNPDYYTVHKLNEQPGEAAYDAKALKIIASFTVLLDEPKTLTLGIYNDKGEMIQKVFENESFGSAGHKFGVDFEASDVPAGKYYIRLKEAATVLQEKVVEVK